ncbi:MAG: VacJ family lipoprotein [Deltaproteobacteria bacterium]|nr:VacJ family lipoprotein [Deltaproteobacteria bacterium]
MRKDLACLVLLTFWASGCAHNRTDFSSATVPLASAGMAEEKPKESTEGKPPALPEPSSSLKSSGEVSSEGRKSDNASPEEENFEEGTGAAIADPLEPFNRAMFQFNDKLYFWLLKPVAQGYNKVVPEPARKGVKNFFTNLGFPKRFFGSLLQGDFRGAAAELGRFAVNTLWGAGGFLDPSSDQQLDIPKREADLGQTLGVYGIGQGFFIIWPILGPSSARDSLGMVGDYFWDPLSYISPWYDSVGVKSYQEVNDVAFRIGDYESFLEATIDPYVALRDAYTQYRLKKIEMGKGKSEPPKPAGMR